MGLLDAVNNPEWPEPTPFVTILPPLAGMPDGIDGTALGVIADELEAKLGILPLLTVATGLGVAAAAGTGNLKVQIASGAEFPTALYLAPLANPGGMKSAVLSLLAKPLVEAQARHVEDRGPAVALERMQAESYRGAIKKMCDELANVHAGKPPGKESRSASVLVTDIGFVQASLLALESSGVLDGVEVVVVGADMTYEAIIQHAARNGGRIAMLSAEGGLLENLAGRYSDGVGARTEFLNSAYDGEPFDGARVSDGARKIPEPWATILLVVQPDVFTTMLVSPAMRRRGFLQRFLSLLVPDGDYRHRHEMPKLNDAVMGQWSKAISGLWDAMATPKVVTLSADAAEILLAFEKDVIAPAFKRGQEDNNFLLAGWLSKLAMTSTRIAAVIGQLEDPGADQVTGDAARAAVGFANACITHADYLFAHGPEAAARSPRFRVLAWFAGGSEGIERVAPDIATTREVGQRFKDQAWCTETEAARFVLEDLTKLGWLRGPTLHTTEKGGRPSQRWELHPKMVEHFIAMTGRVPKTKPNSDENISTDTGEDPLNTLRTSDPVDMASQTGGSEGIEGVFPGISTENITPDRGGDECATCLGTFDRHGPRSESDPGLCIDCAVA